MFFQFRCEDCQPAERPAAAIGKLIVTEFDVWIKYGKKAPALGSKRKCVCCGRKTAKRIISSGISFIIRGQTEINLENGQSMMTHVNGQDIKMTFVDHPHTSPEYQRDLSRLAARAGVGAPDVSGLKNAYWSEKHNQLVVDVHSNVKDPLGTLNKSIKNAPPPKITKRHIGQKFKIRGKS